MNTVPSTLRIMYNNFSDIDTGRLSYSSQKAGYPISNCLNNSKRYKVWKPTGHFEITASNRNIYINDGVDKTVQLTIGHYATAALLVAHIQTQLNAVSSGWTCAYSSTTFKFTIANSGSVSLRFSQTSNACWDTLGYIGTSDETGTSFVADAQRNHTHEFITFNFGYNQNIKFIGLISPKQIAFPFSHSATIKIQASNVENWETPDLEEDLEIDENGAFVFLDVDNDTAYAYWRIYIEDKLNPSGPELQISQVYIGDYFTFPARPVNRGYSKGSFDPSEGTESMSGVRYFDTKISVDFFRSIQIDIAERDDKDGVERIFKMLGKHTPFFISIDPEKDYTDKLSETTKYVFFESEPSEVHTVRDFFTLQFNFSEAI